MNLKHYLVFFVILTLFATLSLSVEFCYECSEKVNGLPSYQCDNQKQAHCSLYVSAETDLKDAACLSRITTMSDGSLVLEKKCITRAQLKSESFDADNLTMSGCGSYAIGRVKYCICHTDYCNGLSYNEVAIASAENLPQTSNRAPNQAINMEILSSLVLLCVLSLSGFLCN